MMGRLKDSCQEMQRRWCKRLITTMMDVSLVMDRMMSVQPILMLICLFIPPFIGMLELSICGDLWMILGCWLIREIDRIRRDVIQAIGKLFKVGKF